MNSVVDEIEDLNRLGINKIFFAGSIFNYPPKHIEDICREIVDREIKIKWKALFNESFMDRNTLMLAKEAGCEEFVFGPDDSSDKMLASIKKSFNYNKMISADGLLKKERKTKVKCCFMLNAPKSDFRDILNIAKLILILGLRKNFRLWISSMRIYPYTELYSIALREGKINKRQNLILPEYYNPFPLRTVGWILNFVDNLLYRFKNFRYS